MAPCKSSHNCSALGYRSQFQFSTSLQNSQLWLRAEVRIIGFPPLNTQSGRKRNNKIFKMYYTKLQDNITFLLILRLNSSPKYTVSLVKVWNVIDNVWFLTVLISELCQDLHCSLNENEPLPAPGQVCFVFCLDTAVQKPQEPHLTGHCSGSVLSMD